MNIAVIGTGYVGLVTGTCLSETGNTVTCVDIDQEKIEKLQAGIIPIYEPQLDIFFERNIKQGRLNFTTQLAKAIAPADIVFLALPTPPGEDGSADLSYVLGVAEDLSRLVTSYKVIVDKSTVPVGTSEKVKGIISKGCSSEFDVVSNPEFLREGYAVEDFMKPDRIIIGTGSPRAQKVMETLYKPFVRQGNPIIVMDERSAELTKYAANAFLATKISFMNEMANLCERLNADVDNVRIGIGSDPRIGRRFLFPGIGYGGSCFPKDVNALAQTSKSVQYDFQILAAVQAVNAAQKQVLFDKITTHYGPDLKGKRFAVWGLAFKPNTDDIREAPSLTIIRALLEKGAKVNVYDPEAMKNFKARFGHDLIYAYDQYSALEDAHALLILTEWSIFRAPDFNLIASRLKDNVIFDGRNVFDHIQLEDYNFTYYSIGRKPLLPI